MKKYITPWVFLIVGQIAFAQRSELRWSPESKFNKKSDELGFVGKVDDHFYTLRKEDKVMFLAKNQVRSMSQVWERPIIWNDLNRTNTSDKNLTFHSFRKFQHHFEFYFQDYNKGDDTQRLYAQRINYEGEPDGELREIGVRQKKRRSKDGSYRLAFAEDSLHSLLMINPGYDKYNDEKFHFKVLDEDQNILKNFTITLPFKDKDFSVSGLKLLGDHTIYMLASIHRDKKERDKGQPAYNYKILIMDVASAKPRMVDIPFRNKYVDQIDLVLDRGKVKCVGLYGDLKPNGKVDTGAKGAFHFSLEKGEAGKISFREFSHKLILEIAGKKNIRKGEGLGYRYSLKNTFTKEDGGLVVLFEESYIRIVTSTDSRGNSTTTTHYHDNSVLYLDIDPAGEINRYVHVPKKQHTANYGHRFGSFHAMYVDGNTHIIYNDEKGNALINMYDKTMKNYLKAVPVIVTITASGKMNKKQLTGSSGKQDFALKPKLSDKISSNEAFLYADNMSKACCVVGARKVKTTKIGILSIQ